MGKEDRAQEVDTASSQIVEESSSSFSCMDDVCKELDLLLLRKLELLQEYVDLSLKAQVHQKDGYLHLAKSRYSDGGAHSTTRVILSTSTDETVVESEAVATTVSSSTNEDDGVDEIQCLMKSKLVFADGDSPGQGQKCNSLLKQFGLLPSSSVKNAQKSFRNSLTLYVDKNNVFRELHRLEERFSELQMKKIDILDQELDFKAEP